MTAFSAGSFLLPSGSLCLFLAVTTCGLLAIGVPYASETIAAITVCNSVISHTNLHNGNRSPAPSNPVLVLAKLGKHGKKSCQLLIEVKTTITTALLGLELGNPVGNGNGYERRAMGDGSVAR